MRSCVRKVRWLSMEDIVPSGRGEFKPVEIPLVTVEAGSPFRRIGEQVTRQEILIAYIRDLSV
ncbi:hypothetical protein IX51_02075 [uncultured archaeon]|nr:hypothetical protein IX51_02075 [uncultured archaeon]